MRTPSPYLVLGTFTAAFNLFACGYSQAEWDQKVRESEELRQQLAGEKSARDKAERDYADALEEIDALRLTLTVGAGEVAGDAASIDHAGVIAAHRRARLCAMCARAALRDAIAAEATPTGQVAPTGWCIARHRSGAPVGTQDARPAGVAGGRPRDHPGEAEDARKHERDANAMMPGPWKQELSVSPTSESPRCSTR